MDDFDETIARLAEQVSQFKTDNTVHTSSGMKLPELNLSSPIIYYSIVPLVFFIGFITLKPSFVMKENDDKKEIFNYSKILLITLVLSGICIAGFIYLLPMYKKRITS